jgi:hypothetical protein
MGTLIQTAKVFFGEKRKGEHVVEGSGSDSHSIVLFWSINEKICLGDKLLA